MTNLPDSILHHVPWSLEVNPIWPASAFFLHRNIAGFHFPIKLTDSTSARLLSLLEETFQKTEKGQGLLYFGANKLTPKEKAFLSEHFLSFEDWQHTDKNSAFMLDPQSRLLAVLNVHDHILLHWIDSEGQWDKAWKELSTFEEELGSHLNYAFSSRFGYLTSNPVTCGTGLSVICYLHLPSLIHSGEINKLLPDPNHKSINAVGIIGEKETLDGDFVLLQNKRTIGITEEAIFQELHMTTTRLILAEERKREEYKAAKPIEIQDRVSKAYGLLKHACQLETKEALQAISAMKLGLWLGWIEGISDGELNEILFRCRRAHLLQSNEKITLNKKELAHARAELLHEKLKKVKLLLDS